MVGPLCRRARCRVNASQVDIVDRRDHVLITRNGKPAAALVPIDEYEALEETAEILSDADALIQMPATLSTLPYESITRG